MMVPFQSHWMILIRARIVILIKQTSTFVLSSLSKLSKDFSDLKEIILHFKLMLHNEDGAD